MREKFNELIRSFCTSVGLDEPARILEGNTISSNEVCFPLIYNEQVDVSLLFVYGDVGSPAADVHGKSNKCFAKPTCTCISA